MEYTTHISITEAEGQSVVTVDDYELFDFLDDFFVEQNLKAISISRTLGPDGMELHSIHFASPQSAESILRFLTLIPVAEIERIYSLNNGQPKP